MIDAVIGIAKSRGVQLRVYMEPSTQVTEIPPAIHGLLKEHRSLTQPGSARTDRVHPTSRREGQRWSKITYFRDLDLLHTPRARFPIEVIGEIMRAPRLTAFPKGRFDLHFTDVRGSDLRIGFTPDMRENQFATNRWRGKMTAEEDGCYVHYLAHSWSEPLGPQLGEERNVSVKVAMSGVLTHNGRSFDRPFEEKIAVVFNGEYVSAVSGESAEAKILREMLVGGRMIEGGGCGFNPKAPRHTVYPAGSNAPGALHFGIDLAKPSEYIRRVLPDWEEPPVHMDLITLDSTVTAGDQLLVDAGFLCALRDARVVEAASRYGDPIEMLEAVVL